MAGRKLGLEASEKEKRELGEVVRLVAVERDGDDVGKGVGGRRKG